MNYFGDWYDSFVRGSTYRETRTHTHTRAQKRIYTPWIHHATEIQTLEPVCSLPVTLI